MAVFIYNSVCVPTQVVPFQATYSYHLLHLPNAFQLYLDTVALHAFQELQTVFLPSLRITLSLLSGSPSAPCCWQLYLAFSPTYNHLTKLDTRFIALHRSGLWLFIYTFQSLWKYINFSTVPRFPLEVLELHRLCRLTVFHWFPPSTMRSKHGRITARLLFLKSSNKEMANWHPADRRKFYGRKWLLIAKSRLPNHSRERKDLDITHIYSEQFFVWVE